MNRRYQDPISDPSVVTDDELLGLMARRDEGAVRELFRRYAPFLLAMAKRMGFAEESLPFVHDTFVRLWDDSRRFDPVKMAARTWIVTAAHRLAVNRIAASGRAALTPERPADPGGPQGAFVENPIYVSGALDRLDPLARQLLELAFFGGCDHQELVTSSGRSPATVKTTMRRALASLHDGQAVRER